MQEQDKKTEQDIPVTETAAAEAAQANPDLSHAADPGAQNNDQLVAELQAKVAELQDAFMRAKAEGENIRRRAQDDIAKAHKFAIEGFAEAMVPVKDSLEMALKVETPSIDSLKEGVELTLKQLSSAFEKNRLLEVNPLQGEKLDPDRHQAISMVPAEQDANTVVTVLQKGYMIADRLLRPALVTVAQGK
ncbi:nucleotide exchange factor GrpE [Undibacterium crateris]|uniref:nucleotide exchange factor GrpE n=1 Tax=Undibacterium crateris TaxID=2528175 RepID=UPI001389E3F3|nr:nucleotide exchange factor GrpE [Undibacterium crateris]NDI86236.1 nucleotide exchange factor GrpE [Undibacterium crateris]